jgi:hypothetical protein
VSRENYFVLLGLDPDRDANNAAAIQAQIAAKQNEWSRGRNHPTKGKHCQMYLALIPKIKDLMLKDAERQQEADEAKKLLTQRQADALKEFDEQAAVAAGKGYLTDADVAALAARFKGALTDADVRARAQKLGIALQKGPTKQAVNRPRLDSADETRIADNLAIVGKANLYEFLGLGLSATARTLLSKANDVYADVRKIATKDAAISAQQDLAGDCMKVFTSEKEREKYDGSLAWTALDGISKLAEAGGAGEGRISAGTMDRILEAGKKQGIGDSEVIDAVQAVAKQRGWYVQVPAEPAAKKLQRCGACGELADEKIANCPNRNCGVPFKSACPKCGTINSSESHFCAKQGCGFAVGDMPLGARAARDARMAFSQGDAAEASRLLALALAYWPGHPEATKLGAEVKRRIDDEQKAARALDEAATKAERAVVEAVAKKEFFVKASPLLAELRRIAPKHPRLADLENQMKAGLTLAAKHVEQARQRLREGKADDAIDAYNEALRACSDFRDAQDGLIRCPPDAPATLTASVSPRAIVLSWPASRSRHKVSYRLIRKERSEPTAPTDGVVIGETPGTSLTDPNASPGMPFYYAVYAKRENVFSAKAACVGPQLRAAEVTELKTTPGDGSVSLEWQLPTGARAIEIWRNIAAVPRRGEGTRLSGVSLRSAQDTGLKNGTSYGYRVVVVYEGADGRPLPSEGETCLATPVEPPKPVTDLRIARRGPHFEALWTVPKAGQVRLYALAAPPVQRCGEMMALTAADALGRRISTNGPGSAREPVPGRAELHLLPVTVVGALAVVGRSVAVSWIDDVEGLTARVSDGVLRAAWQWPSAIDMAVLVWRTDAYPSGPEDPSATRVEWPRQRYQIEGGFRQPAPEAERLFLAVYAAVSRADRWEYGAGPARIEVAVNSQRTVRYTLGKGGWLSGHSGEMRLTLTPDAPTKLPDMVLVAKMGGIPLNPTDGTALLGLVAGLKCDPAQPLVRWFRPPPDIASCQVRLFPVNDADCSWLTVVAD